LLVVIGASGSGKSSLLTASVLLQGIVSNGHPGFTVFARSH
jgi:ABC-type lipoprotein export system ATPase subunit